MVNANQLRDGVRSVLVTRWDPIGIQDLPAAWDEYDAYVSTLASMLLAKVSAADVSQYLLDIETGAMGLPGDRERARAVADMLIRFRG